MSKIDCNTLLHDKIKADQSNYRDWFFTQPPEEILNHTYKYTMREDM